MRNIKHQIKSSWYYILWGIMSFSVVAGQVFVGTGYREMSDTIKQSVLKLDLPSNPQRNN